MVRPAGGTTIVDRMEVRAGGAWRFVHRDADGSETEFRGTYREVTPPERIVQTWEWEGMPGHVSVETATFEDIDGGRTKVTTVALFHTTEERDGMLASGWRAARTRPTSAWTRCSRGSRRPDGRPHGQGRAPGIRLAAAASVSPGLRQLPSGLEPYWQKCRTRSQLRVLKAPFSRMRAVSRPGPQSIVPLP